MLCSVIGLALDITRHSAMCPIPLIELSYLSVLTSQGRGLTLGMILVHQHIYRK